MTQRMAAWCEGCKLVFDDPTITNGYLQYNQSRAYFYGIKVIIVFCYYPLQEDIELKEFEWYLRDHLFSAVKSRQTTNSKKVTCTGDE